MTKIKGTIRVLTLESKILAGNPLGDPSTRRLPVYLPPQYESDGDRRFPVTYCLTGFTGKGTMFLNESPFSPNLPERLDGLMEEGRIEPMLVVMPDCFTKYGGSQYINSSATGDYEDYLTEEIVPFIDAEFRTIPNRGSRAVAGKSSGGYGALIMAMRHADLFSAAASISGDCYFEICYKPDFRKAFRAINGDPLALIEKFWDEERAKGKHDFDGLNAIGMSACYSPNPDSELGFDLPFDESTGEIREDVWSRWLEHDPVHIASGYVDALRSLKLLYVDSGNTDEFGLDIGAKVLCDRLKELGIDHRIGEFDGGHFNINYRYDYAFEEISRALSASG